MIEYISILLFTFPLTRVFLGNKKKNSNKIKTCLFIWLFGMIFVSGMRGSFTADSYSYQKIFRTFSEGGFNAFISAFSLHYHFNMTEIGYIFINFIVGLFTDKFIWLQIVVAIITYIPIAKWCLESDDVGLSLCLFLAIGPYIESLNTVRNIMAASIYILGLKYVFTGEFRKYLVVVLLASTIHLSVLVMIPVFFVLRFKPTIGKIFLYVGGTFVFVFCMENLAQLYNSLFLIAANSESVLELLHRRQANPINVIVPVVIVMFTLIIYYTTAAKNELNDMKNIVLVSGTIFWGLLKITMLSSEYISRFACYFSPFILLLLPKVLNRFKGMQKIMLSAMIYTLCGIFFIIECKSYGNYYYYQ